MYFEIRKWQVNWIILVHEHLQRPLCEEKHIIYSSGSSIYNVTVGIINSVDAKGFADNCHLSDSNMIE